MHIFQFLEIINTEQVIVFLIIGFVMIAMLSRFLRYDLVSILALLLITLTGVLTVEETFLSFVDSVVLIVISMFIITQALLNSGFIDFIARKLGILDRHPILQITALTTIVALTSAFVNNIGALVAIIPVAIHLANKNKMSPAIFLMPLAFGSHLGGYLTLIGTPRNIIVSGFREEAGLGPYGMFDFAPVGLFLALIGITFLSVVGWRLLSNKKETASKNLFEIVDYFTEVAITENSKIAGEFVNSIEKLSKNSVTLIALVRKEITINNVSGYEILRPGDHLILQADSDSLKNFVEEFGLDLTGERALESREPEDESGSVESVITPDSLILGKRWDEIPFPIRYGVNLLAVSRTGSQIKTPLANIRFQSGDVLLLHGKKESIQKTISELRCYPLVDRELTLGQKTTIPLTLMIILTTILIATFTSIPLGVLFLTSAFITVITNIVPLKQAYDSIQWPVVILIGTMITIGMALQKSGGADTLASMLVSSSNFLSPIFLVIIILVLSTLISNLVSTTVSAVTMAPIAFFVALSIGLSVDTFLMAVAVGSTSAFFTSFGHESNALVQEMAKYSTYDYLRVGLPLQIIITAVSIPLILYFWPL